MSSCNTSPAAMRGHAKAIREIIEAYKASGKEIRLVPRVDRYRSDPQGYRYDYLNDAGTDLKG